MLPISLRALLVHIAVASPLAASWEVGASQRQRTSLETSQLSSRKEAKITDPALPRVTDSPVRLAHARRVVDKTAPDGAAGTTAKQSSATKHWVAAARAGTTAPLALDGRASPTRRQPQHERRGMQEQFASAVRSERTAGRLHLDDVRMAEVQYPTTTADLYGSTTTGGATTTGPGTLPMIAAAEAVTTTTAQEEETASSSLWIVTLLVIIALIGAVCFAAYKMRLSGPGSQARASVASPSPDGALASGTPKAKERSSAVVQQGRSLDRQSSAPTSRTAERPSAAVQQSRSEARSSAAPPSQAQASASRGTGKPLKQSESDADQDSEVSPVSPVTSPTASPAARARGTGAGYSARRAGSAAPAASKAAPEAGI